MVKFDRPGNLKLSDGMEFFCCSNIVEIDDENYSNFDLKPEWIKDEELEFAIESFLSVLMVLEKIRAGLDCHVLNAKHHEKEAHIIRQAGRLAAITIATNMAGRGTDIVLGGFLSIDPKQSGFDKVDSDAQKLIQARGGLHVIGTERHESRRVDNQLRGRCARQGDAGSARFYLSLEDNLMRIFGGDKIIAVMNMLKADEDLPIEATMVSGAINNAQKKVEAHHFDIRKHVLQYDDVINTQREVIYRERRLILEGADIHDNIVMMFNERVEEIVFTHMGPNDQIETWFDVDEEVISPIAQVFETLKADLGDDLKGLNRPSSAGEFIANYRSHEEFIARVKADVMMMLDTKEAEVGSKILREAERQIMLHVIDSKWIEHIHAMDSLKDGIHLQSYGQKDPLIEYKKEAFAMFDELLLAVRKDTVVLFSHAQIVNEATKEAAGS
jgi:preprotein translocase subunit SecA